MVPHQFSRNDHDRNLLFRGGNSIRCRCSLLIFIATVVASMICYEMILPNVIRQDGIDITVSVNDRLKIRPDSACDESNVYPMTTTCNCLATTVLDGWGGTCCSRTLRHAHKMGNHLARKAMPWEMWSDLRIATDTFRYSKPKHDYRDVVIVRDFYSTLVSGYLYHRKGHECWLDALGRPSNVSTIDPQWWQTIRTAMPFPVRNKRSLCQYLVDESEEHGLHLYMHMSLHFWFKQMAAQYAYRQSAADANRTMFVCFDELSSVDTQAALLQQMVAHLWPGAHNFRFSSLAAQTNYSGAHSTKDIPDDVKTGLREKIAKLDQQYYSGEVATMNALFGCAIA